MKIKSIYPSGNADVYNMEVSDTHSFLVENGFVVHNCYDETRYACMSRPMTGKPPREPETMIQKHKRKLIERREKPRFKFL